MGQPRHHVTAALNLPVPGWCGWAQQEHSWLQRECKGWAALGLFGWRAVSSGHPSVCTVRLYMVVPVQ